MPNDFSWMERAAFIVASGMEVVMLLVLVIGAVRAIKTIAGHVLRRQPLASDVREIWMHFAGWIVLALEFALAADLIETVIAPSWREIGQLAVEGLEPLEACRSSGGSSALRAITMRSTIPPNMMARCWRWRRLWLGR